MKQCYYKNGYYELSGWSEEEIPWWVTIPKKGKKIVPYFILNCYTRELFKQDILPYKKAGELEISQQDFDRIVQFIQNPRHVKSKVAMPAGITFTPSQLEASEKMMEYLRYAFFMGTGTGKTLLGISAILTYRPKHALIITPLAVRHQYEEECKKYGANLVSSITILNSESSELTKQLTGRQPDMLIIDESHKMKNYTSDANSLMRVISANAKWVYLFTGTPQDKLRHDILSQLAILDNRVMPTKSKTLERYFEINDYYQPSSEKREFREELSSVISEYSWGIPTDEVIDIPENNIVVPCKHPGKEYDTLLDTRVLQIEREGKKFTTIAENKATLRIKLRELAAGHIFMQDEDNKEIELFTTNYKVADLRDTLLHCKHGIIYTDFIADVEICKKVIDSFSSNNWGTLTRNANANTKTINAFKSGEINFLILNAKSGGTGLDLQRTNNIIFYTLPESFILFQQCKGRIKRIGQKETCNYYYLLSKGSVEEQQYGALLKKQSFNNKSFRIYK